MVVFGGVVGTRVLQAIGYWTIYHPPSKGEGLCSQQSEFVSGG